MDEIQFRCESLTGILKKRGVKEWLYSMFSSSQYMINVIDMIVDTYKNKIEDFLKMIEKESNEYLTKVIHKINYHIKSSTMEFSGIQQKKWNEIRDKYEKTKDKIIEIQNKIK